VLTRPVLGGPACIPTKLSTPSPRPFATRQTHCT